MSEISDFSKYDRDNQPDLHLSPDDTAFFTTFDAQATTLLEAHDPQMSAELKLCKQLYVEALDQRTEALTLYLSDQENAELAKYVKQNEVQLHAQFCEYTDLLLHAPVEDGPRAIFEISEALVMADASQQEINQSRGVERQFDADKLKQAIVGLIMSARDDAETQAVISELYRRHIRDIVINFVDDSQG